MGKPRSMPSAQVLGERAFLACLHMASFVCARQVHDGSVLVVINRRKHARKKKKKHAGEAAVRLSSIVRTQTSDQQNMVSNGVDVCR